MREIYARSLHQRAPCADYLTCHAGHVRPVAQRHFVRDPTAQTSAGSRGRRHDDGRSHSAGVSLSVKMDGSRLCSPRGSRNISLSAGTTPARPVTHPTVRV